MPGSAAPSEVLRRLSDEDTKRVLKTSAPYAGRTRVPDRFESTQAAVRAGYSAKTAKVIGAQNLSKLNVATALEKARAERAERCALSADWVVEELRKIAGANAWDLFWPNFSQLRKDHHGVLISEPADGSQL